MPARRIWLLALAAAGLLPAAGCGPLHKSSSEAHLRQSGRYQFVEALDVPAAPGAEGCGAQALAAVLVYEGAADDAVQIASALPWAEKGATPVDVLLAARQRGYEATIARGTWDALRTQTATAHPVLVLLDVAPNAPTVPVRIGRAMHWSVVSGIARDGSTVLLAAPKARHNVVRRADFMRRWETSDYCMITVRGRP